MMNFNGVRAAGPEAPHPISTLSGGAAVGHDDTLTSRRVFYSQHTSPRSSL